MQDRFAQRSVALGLHRRVPPTHSHAFPQRDRAVTSQGQRETDRDFSDRPARWVRRS